MANAEPTDTTEPPKRVRLWPDGERRVTVHEYPGGDMHIELGHIDITDELYVLSGEADALREAFARLDVQCAICGCTLADPKNRGDPVGDDGDWVCSKIDCRAIHDGWEFPDGDRDE